MFGNVVPAKKKDIKIEDDRVLADILNELESGDNHGANGSAAQSGAGKAQAKSNEKAEMKSFMADFAQASRRPPEKATVDSTSDDVSVIHPASGSFKQQNRTNW